MGHGFGFACVDGVVCCLLASQRWRARFETVAVISVAACGSRALLCGLVVDALGLLLAVPLQAASLTAITFWSLRVVTSALILLDIRCTVGLCWQQTRLNTLAVQHNAFALLCCPHCTATCIAARRSVPHAALAVHRHRITLALHAAASKMEELAASVDLFLTNRAASKTKN